MSQDFEEIRKIARASLMADFFAVRIEEEKLYASLQQLIAKITLPTPMAQLERIKQLAIASPEPRAFLEGIKTQNLWTTLRELITKVKVA